MKYANYVFGYSFVIVWDKKKYNLVFELRKTYVCVLNNF